MYGSVWLVNNASTVTFPPEIDIFLRNWKDGLRVRPPVSYKTHASFRPLFDMFQVRMIAY